MVLLQLGQLGALPSGVVALLAIVAIIVVVRIVVSLVIKAATIGLIVFGAAFVLDKVLGVEVPVVSTFLTIG